MRQKPQAVPPSVFPLLVSAVISRDKPKDQPSTTAPDPQHNSDPVEEPIDTIALGKYIAAVAPLSDASGVYAKAHKIRQQLRLINFKHMPVEIAAKNVSADPRLTGLNEIYQIGGM